MPSDKAERGSKRSSRDATADESISVLDPRRFTPTLHANLVSEILNLRRDQEDKLKIIESLETTLHATKEEQEALQASVSSTGKENRSLKRQLALLEGGTSSALGELARERDEAVDAIADTRKRLETAQKKVRSQEDDSQRSHELWSKEREGWEEERRRFERKLHVADTRMKAMLEEVASLHAAQANRQNGATSEGDEAVKDDAASVRTMSLTNSIRYSAAVGKSEGQTLADELDFDDDEWQTDMEGRESVLSYTHQRNFSKDSVMSKTHHRNVSNDSQWRPGSAARGKVYANQHVLDQLEGGISEDDEVTEDEATQPPKLQYTDTGVQFSPPPSPKAVPGKPSAPVSPPNKMKQPVEAESSPRGEGEIEANQRRKRVQINKPASLLLEPSPLVKATMVSSASQTLEAPPTPPKTPRAPIIQVDHISIIEPPASPEMTCSATQTDVQPVEPPVVQQPIPTLPIPSISIHPPTSRPPSPREPRLPQYSKDFGCQVSLLSGPLAMTSTAVQTDEIRVDMRLAKLPPHLHPSAITSRPTTPNTGIVSSVEGGADLSSVPGKLPPRNPRRLANKRSFTNEPVPSPPASPSSPLAVETDTRDAYPGNNDNGPLSSLKAPVRRPHRISSLFAGFDGGSSDEVDELLDGDMSDSEFKTALSAPNPTSSSRHKSKDSAATTSTIDTAPSVPRHRRNRQPAGFTETYSSYHLAEGRDKISPMGPSARPGDKAASSRAPAVMRKSALIQSGIASHRGRATSPNTPEVRDPPFPIPTRASSRQPMLSTSLPSDGSRSPSAFGGYGHYRRGSRSTYRSNSIRKVRSAAALPRSQPRARRYESRSPPPLSPSEVAVESPGLPPLPTNDITSPQARRYGGKLRGHRSQQSTTTAYTENTNTDNTNEPSIASGQQASGVVDAIAQTMVGEWMYKYVRRRKSFGMADPKGEENSNDRHKRWVWLAPYERAILWSSKQPSSGSALMGKSGRKLSIQSVLDVKDDNPAPKGVSPLFDRSILILTPQRALKFTAITAERHYLWLTSLSFLAHSSQAVPAMLSPSVPPPGLSPGLKSAPILELGPPPASKKKAGIRDSIRLTKGKNQAMTHTDPVMSPSHLEESLTFKPAAHGAPSHGRELSREVAEPPFIPRYHERSSERTHERTSPVVIHGRKRSNTGSHIPPPLSFRGFSGPAGPAVSDSYHTASNSTAANSVGTAGSSDIYGGGSSTGATTWVMSPTLGSTRTSEASSRPGNNFFEAIGTVRMEAFISPLAFPRYDEQPRESTEYRHRVRRRSREVRRRRRSRSRHRDSYTSRNTRGTDDWYSGSRTGGEEDYFRDDPFKGF